MISCACTFCGPFSSGAVLAQGVGIGQEVVYAALVGDGVVLYLCVCVQPGLCVGACGWFEACASQEGLVRFVALGTSAGAPIRVISSGVPVPAG